ncbi:Hsp70 family protein [Rhodococcus sp. IEGM 1379]|uniref:Hsp70 family protein n=1 Tax=Rhodococcus sp. IEGM 1379 TaxID=3047086 RepID=UPI0024B7EF90|nr:Hsp70 family protein [Rhodococcus sp. IEGM 1379]MDI9915093.1 Hsp70 family protein [Rhodococcus sp. IEGM 1379]
MDHDQASSLSTAGLGIGIGSATLVAVAADAAGETREPVHCPSAVNTADGARITGFIDRVGDSVAILAADGSEHRGEDLTASAISRLVDAARSDGETFDSVVVAHPVGWNRHTTLTLESALDAKGIPGVGFISEPEAVMTWFRDSGNAVPDGLTVIYDLGGCSLDVTMMSTADGRSTVFGKPLRSADIGGDEFDHAVTVHLLGSVADHFRTLDAFAPETISALEVLRTRARQAKEQLSTDTETVVHVELPGKSQDIRLVRSELEDLIRPALTESVALVRESLRCAGVESSDINHVVLAGGSSAIPLVAELLSSELRVPLIAAADPGSCAAVGAAIIAVELLSATKTAATRVPLLPVRNPAPVPAFSTPLITAPTAEDSTTRRSSRVGVIAAVVGAFIVLAAGGLGIGTAMDKIDVPSSSADTTSEIPAPTGSTVSNLPPGERLGNSVIGGSDAVAPGSNAQVGQAGSPASQSGVATGAGVAAPVAPPGSAPAPGTPGVSAPASGAPVGVPAPAPAPVPAPAPAPTPGGQTGDAGNAVGDAATGVGNGLGAVVDGAGNAVGGVLGGVGGLVGGVVGAVIPNR